MSSLHGVKVEHAFGLRSDVGRCVTFQDEHTLIYPCGSGCVVDGTDTREQHFLPCNSAGGGGVSSLAISANRRFLAIGEYGERATIAIWDLSTFKRRKVLTSSEITAQSFVSLAFSADGKVVAAQSGRPDWILLYWSWAKGKILSSAKTTNSQNSPVRQVSFHPTDSSLVVIVGDGIMRLLRYSMAEGSLKQVAFHRVEPQPFTCHAWLGEELLAVATELGKVLICPGGEVRQEVTLSTPRSLTSATDASYTASEETAGRSLSAGSSTATGHLVSTPVVSCMATTHKHIFVGCGQRVVFLERTGPPNREQFEEVGDIQLPVTELGAKPNAVVHLVVSPSEEFIVACTENSQMFTFATSDTDNSTVKRLVFERIGPSFHYKAITDMSVCCRKPILATCSLDSTIHVWNYETGMEEISKQFSTEVYAVALHPSGLFLLAGFSDKMRLFNILIDDFSLIKEFTVRACRECAFSHGGHVFAATNASLIQLYSTYSFERVANLKGHDLKIRSLAFSSDDSRLISCATEGKVVEWNLSTFAEDGEVTIGKGNPFLSTIFHPERDSAFALTENNELLEISPKEGTILHHYSTGGVKYAELAFSHTNRILFAATKMGAVRSLKFPLTDPMVYHDFFVHRGAITKMMFSSDEQYLFTAGEDGSVFVFTVFDAEGLQAKMKDADVAYADEILIFKPDLQAKNEKIAQLRAEIHHLQTDNSFQLRMRESTYEGKVRELTQKCTQEMQMLRARNKALYEEIERAKERHKHEREDEEERHLKTMQSLEQINNQKLKTEMEKYQDLQRKYQGMQERGEQQIAQMEKQKEQEIAELTDHFEAKLSSREDELNEASASQHHQRTEFEEVRSQIGEDAEREILDVKNVFEQLLCKERDIHKRISEEQAVIKKKYDAQETQIGEYKSHIELLQNQRQQLQGIVLSLQRDIEVHQRETQERDETIKEKDGRIRDLNKKNVELDKFKFVLDYKTKDLKRKIAPREEAIESKNAQLTMMDAELLRFRKENGVLRHTISHLKQKLSAAQLEIQSQQEQADNLESLLQVCKTDLSQAVRLVDDSKQLKRAIVSMQQKHLQEDEKADASSLVKDPLLEYHRQRKHLEQSGESLQKKMMKETEIHRQDNMRIMQENVTLLKEINDLRYELKVARTQVHSLEEQDGSHRYGPSSMSVSLTGSASALLPTSSSVTLETSTDHSLKKKSLDPAQRHIVELQRAEIRRLKQQIARARELCTPELPQMSA